ncbi:sensor histidine kinase [Rhizobium straminoryzae]|uniref:histidine kinase n=1 Tax=Rhizobium straminoryzae TaxID=1387186 RepID=A0A549T7I4_9HYPH|nr:HAMP domain-containing sensor histidine kinase [Rhizobium straminoryzae]TRL37832.1 HAMP domain-containing histidine kinase [Rhizobium straminoryzae]
MSEITPAPAPATPPAPPPSGAPAPAASRPYSLSRRLILSLAGILCLFWVVAVVLGVSVMRDEFDEVFDSALQQTTERLVPLLVDDLYRRDERPEPYSIGEVRHDVRDQYLTYQLRDSTGRVLLHSANTSSVPYAAPLAPGFWSDESHRIFTAETVSGSLFVQVADSLDHRREATGEGAIALIVPIMVLLPFGMLAIWWIVGRAMAPVQRLLGAVSVRDGTNLQPIEMPDLPKELAPIARSINNLMARLETTIQAERDLAANSAHELRTPVAGALAQTELLLREVEGSPAEPRAQQVLKGLRRLSTMLEKLLQLARAEAGIGLATAPVDLAPIFDLVLSEFGRSHPAVTVVIAKEAPALSLPRRVDADAFAIALKNLLENADRHGLPGEPIDVRLSAQGTIVVSNATLPPAEADVNMFRQRFRRGSPATPGSGLGLAIVDRLMTQMGGSLDLSCDRTGEGATFRATLQLPPS